MSPICDGDFTTLLGEAGRPPSSHFGHELDSCADGDGLLCFPWDTDLKRGKDDHAVAALRPAATDAMHAGDEWRLRRATP